MDINKEDLFQQDNWFTCYLSEEKRNKIVYILKNINENLEKKTVIGELHSKTTTIVLLSMAMNELFDWDYWLDHIPYINFDENMCISVVPPFFGAMVRFFVTRKDEKYIDSRSRVSVYLDCHKALGISEPYWEVYPVDGDTGRVPIDDVNGLLELIRKALNYIHAK